MTIKETDSSNSIALRIMGQNRITQRRYFESGNVHYKNAMKTVRYPCDRAFRGTPFDIKT